MRSIRLAVLGSAAAMLLGATSAAQAELELVVHPLGTQLEDTADTFNLRFFGSIEHNSEPPLPDVDSPFTSSEWRIRVQPPDPDPLVPTLDRTTLAGNVNLPPGDPFWTFTLGISTDFTKDSNGFFSGIQGLLINLQGQHLIGPTPADVDPNPLPLIQSSPINADNDEVIRSKGAISNVPHPHAGGGGGVDRYAFRANFQVGPLTFVDMPLARPDGATNPNVRIFAQHIHPPAPDVEPAVPQPTGMTLGASSSFIFYDATSSRLTLTSGVVDGAQSQYPAPGGGGAPATAGADPPFADDPLIDGFAIIRIESAAGFDQVTYQGFDPVRQLHTFSGGTLTLQHFDSFDYAFNATFDELLYDPVSGDGFALFSTVSFTDLLDTAPSVFLDMLTDAHLFGDDPDSMGMMFTFNLPGLAEGSNGFTQDFFSEETTFFLTGVLIPEPTTVGMLLVLLPVIARRRLVDGRKRDKYIFGRPTGTTC